MVQGSHGAGAITPKEFITAVREGRLQPVDIGGGASAFWPDDVNALRTRAP